MFQKDKTKYALILAKILGVALLYAELSKLGLIYFSGHGAVSIFWPAAGFAFSVVLLGGPRYAISVFLGAFAANGTDSNFSALQASGVALANVIEALAGSALLARRGNTRLELKSLGDYFRLVVVGGAVAAIVGAVLGCAVLLGAGKLSIDTYATVTLHWWMGDILGIFILAPLMLVWREWPRAPVTTLRLIEGFALLSFAFLLGQAMFMGWFGIAESSMVGRYWMFLVVAWVAVRLGMHGVVLVLLMACVQGVLASYHNAGMFASDVVQVQEFNFWFFLLVLSMVGMTLAAHFSEYESLTIELWVAKNRQGALLEAIPDQLFEVDSRGTFLQVHARQPELLPAPSEELVGSTFHQKLAPEAALVVQAAIQQAHASGYSTGHQFPVQGSGHHHWFELSVSRMVGKGEGSDPHFIVLARNITARKRAEQDLRIAAIAFESQEGMFVASAQRVILRVNQAFTLITGYDAHDAVGQVSDLLRSGLHNEEFYDHMWDTVNTSGRWQGELWNRRKDGALIACWGTLTAVRDEQGNISHYVRTLTDVTHLRLQEQRRLEKEAELRDALVREVHHRIKNNLQGVTGVLRQFAQRYPTSAPPINEAIAQVQSIAAIHGLQGRTLLGNVSLPQLVQSVAQGVQSLWHVPIALQGLGRVQTCVVPQSDAVPMALVVNELLSNSVKHGGANGQVSVQFHERCDASQTPVAVEIVITNRVEDPQGHLDAVSRASSRASSGLELVAALLPSRGAALEQKLEGHFFVSTLELMSPAVIWELEESKHE